MEFSHIINSIDNPVVVGMTESFVTNSKPFFLVDQSGEDMDHSLIIPGEKQKTHYIAYIDVVLSGADCGKECVIELKDGDTLRYKTVIGLGSKSGTNKQIVFPYPVAISEGSDATIIASAAGVGAITTINVGGYSL